MIRQLSGALLLSLAVAGGAAAATEPEGSFSLLAPVDGAVIRAPEILLVYTVPAGTRTLHRVDGAVVEAPDRLVPGDRQDLHHLRIPLTEGRHRIRVLDGDEGELGALAVTYVPPYSLRTANARGDQAYAFHTLEREKTCAGCHSLPEVFETVPERPLAPAGKVCGACHPRIEAEPSLHGPVAVYACFMCHAPAYAPSRFTQKTSQTAACGDCHVDFLARVLGGKEFVHGPVAAGGCLVCHDPHGGKTTALVRETPPALCLLCHAETLPLPVTQNLHGTVPCTRCHDPHGGQSPELTPASDDAFCASCHPDVAASPRGHPVPGHPVSGDADPSRPGHRLGCASCHGAHAPDDVSRQDPADEAGRRRFCRRCHY